MTDAQQGGRPIHSQGLLLGAIVVGVLILAVYLTQNILEDENGGISAAVRTIGTCLAILAFIRPKAGLYIVTAEAFSVDFIKKVAVYYGTASTGTIIEVLVVTMLAVVGTITGVFIQAVAMRRFKLAPLSWGILVGTIMLSFAMLFAGKTTLGLEKAAENAFNGAVFIALALPMAVYMQDREELNKILKVQFWFVVVWALWGIRQYCFGFTQLEWFYAETGLSAVASEYMLKFANPRPFGFASGAPNYGVISPYFAFGVWYVWHHRRKRVLYTLGTSIILAGLVTSLQRTALLFPFFVPVFYYCFLNKRRTITIYVLAATIFITGVISSEYLYNHVSDINEAISFKGDWAENVLTVSTFTARLDSWRILKSPEMYSFFGLHEEIYSHDVFSKILIAYGVFGLATVCAAAIALTWFIHRTVLRIEDPEDRGFATFLLAVTIPNVALGFIGGGNFTSNPINLQIWTFFGGVVSLVVNSKLAVPAPRLSLVAIRELLGRQATAQPAALQPSPDMARG